MQLNLIKHSLYFTNLIQTEEGKKGVVRKGIWQKAEPIFLPAIINNTEQSALDSHEIALFLARVQASLSCKTTIVWDNLCSIFIYSIGKSSSQEITIRKGKCWRFKAERGKNSIQKDLQMQNNL